MQKLLRKLEENNLKYWKELYHKKKLDCNFILNETKSSGVSIIIVVY